MPLIATDVTVVWSVRLSYSYLDRRRHYVTFTSRFTANTTARKFGVPQGPVLCWDRSFSLSTWHVLSSGLVCVHQFVASSASSLWDRAFSEPRASNTSSMTAHHLVLLGNISRLFCSPCYLRAQKVCVGAGRLGVGKAPWFLGLWSTRQSGFPWRVLFGVVPMGHFIFRWDQSLRL